MKDLTKESITKVTKRSSGEVDVTLSDGETLKSGGIVERNEAGQVVERAALHDADTGELLDGPVIDDAAAALYNQQGIDVPATKASVVIETSADPAPAAPIAEAPRTPVAAAPAEPHEHLSRLEALLEQARHDASLAGHWFVGEVEAVVHALKAHFVA